MAGAAVIEAAHGDTYEGGCHCGGVRWRMSATWSPEAVAPRACDCDFCTRHGAAWVSDPRGDLQVRARGGRLLRYRQGSQQAEFLLCGRCGVLVAVVARDEAGGRWLGAVNRNAFDARGRFGPAVIASPQQLGAHAKLARWLQVWMPAEVIEEA